MCKTCKTKKKGIASSKAWKRHIDKVEKAGFSTLHERLEVFPGVSALLCY